MASRNDDRNDQFQRRMLSGPYQGIGPSGYQRPDDLIHQEIHDRLTLHGWIDARRMTVQVQDGIVTLTGSVNSKEEKRIAEEVIETVSGVRDLRNELRIEKPDHERSAQRSQFRGGELREGMNVGDREGSFIGTIKEIRNQEFLLDRPMARDVWVPIHDCNIMGGQVVLNILADEIAEQDWRVSEFI